MQRTPIARARGGAPSRPRSGRRLRPRRARRRGRRRCSSRSVRAELFDLERHLPGRRQPVRPPGARLVAREALLVRAPEDAVEEVAEGNEDPDDERGLRDLRAEADVAREQHDRREHDRREDQRALERPPPRRRLYLAPTGGRAPLRLGLAGRDVVRVELVPLVVLPDVLVTLLLRAAPPLLAGWHVVDYAAPVHATRPRTTLWTTGPPRWYARCRQSSAATSTTSASKPGRAARRDRPQRGRGRSPCRLRASAGVR